MKIRGHPSFLVIFIFLLTFSRQALALIRFEDAIFPELATSSRGLAMGNAYIAKVDDSMSTFYNPAGLGTVRYPHFHLSNIHAEVNKDFTQMGTGGTMSNAGSNFSKGFKLDGTRQLLLENKGNISHSRFHALPNFTKRFFSAGYLYSKQTRATIGTQPEALFEYADRTDHGPYAALNISVAGGIFKLGASGIILSRKEAIDEQIPTQAVNPVYKKGIGAIVTAGTRLTLPITFLPTFAATVHNAAEQDFSGSQAPATIERTVDVGFSLTPQVGKIMRIHLEADYKDIGQQFHGVNSNRRLGFGMELDFARTFFLRVGYGDGFGSAGIGIATRKLEFDLTTYAVDTTTSQFRGKEDRRFVVSLSSGF